MKKKTKSILAVVLAVLLLLVVIVSLTTNVLFSRSDTPKVFGYYIYMMESDSMEASASVATGVTSLDTDSDTASASVDVATSTTDSENEAASIHQYTAVIARELTDSDLPAKNNAILCVLAEDDTSTDVDSDRIAVRRIYSVEQDDSGVLYYYPTTMKADQVGTEPAITRDNILGLCTYESGELYTFVHFVTSAAGILLLLVLPCIILVIMLIVTIVRVNSRREEEYAFEENYDEVYSEDSYDDEDGYEEELGRTPLYRPSNSGNQTSFEQKRSSIAENFERKAVNPNSPYQKARTMQFKAQHDLPIYTDPEDQIPLSGGRSSLGRGYEGAHGGATSNTGTFGTRRSDSVISHAASETASTGSRTQESSSDYHGSHEASSPEEARNLGGAGRFGTSSGSGSASASGTRSTTSHAAPPSSRTSRNKYDNASVDELLAMIEDEKRKLDK